MGTTPGGLNTGARQQSDLIKFLPSRNLHHGIRLARALGFDLNQLVSINLSLTACVPDQADRAFAKVRESFGKWVRRPPKEQWMDQAPPTFVWVIENPNGCLNAHWLLHVPDARLLQFKDSLPRWVEAAMGEIYDDRALDVRTVHRPMGLEKYLLKGLHPSLARQFNIDYIPQGWVTGRRIGHSKNIGPVQVKVMRQLGQYPPARRWVPM